MRRGRRVCWSRTRRWRRRRRIGGCGWMPLGCMLRDAVFLARPSGEFAPAGDLLSCVDKKVGKETTPAKPPLRGSLRCSKPGARAKLPSLRSGQTVARSQMLMRAAHAPRSSALLGGLEGETQNSQQPSPKAGWRRLFLHPPFEPAEERKALRPRAQRASSSDFAQLSERSVAKRVMREASRLEYRRAARCEAKGRAVRGRLFAFFLVAQKEGRPPGRRPGMGLATKPKQPKQPKRSA